MTDRTDTTSDHRRQPSPAREQQVAMLRREHRHRASLPRRGDAGCHTGKVTTILDREVYTEAEAARLLRVRGLSSFWLCS